MALALRIVPAALVLTCWLLAGLLIKPTQARRWPLLLAPMGALMVSSILAFVSAKLALDGVRLGAEVETAHAAELLAAVLLGEVSVWGWSALGFFGVAAIEALRVPRVAEPRPKWAWGFGAVALVAIPAVALGMGDSPGAWLMPAVLILAVAPLMASLLRPDADDGRRSQRMVTIAGGVSMGAMVWFLAVRRLNEGLGYRWLLEQPDALSFPALQGWGLLSGFVVCGLVGVMAILSLFPARVGQAPEDFASSLLIALGVSTASLIFNVPTHFAKDYVRAYTQPGQFVVIEHRLGELPELRASEPAGESLAVMMLEKGEWFDSRTGIPVELPVQDPERYMDRQGRLTLALRPDAPAQELLVSPFGVGELAVVVRSGSDPGHDALAHTVHAVVSIERTPHGEHVPMEMSVSELLESCPTGCQISPG